MVCYAMFLCYIAQTVQLSMKIMVTGVHYGMRCYVYCCIVQHAAPVDKITIG